MIPLIFFFLVYSTQIIPISYQNLTYNNMSELVSFKSLNTESFLPFFLKAKIIINIKEKYQKLQISLINFFSFKFK